MRKMLIITEIALSNYAFFIGYFPFHMKPLTSTGSMHHDDLVGCILWIIAICCFFIGISIAIRYEKDIELEKERMDNEIVQSIGTENY